MSAIELRFAGPRDLDGLVRLEAQCFADPWSRQFLEEELSHAESLVLVAWSAPPGAELLAYLAVRCPGPEAELLRFAVAPQTRRQGLGRRLLERALRELADRGARECFLEVRCDNGPAIELYRALGAQRICSRKHYYSDRTDALVYRLDLPPRRSESSCTDPTPMVR